MEILFADLDDLGAAISVGHVEEFASRFVVSSLVSGHHFVLILAFVKTGYHGVQGFLVVAAHGMPELNLEFAAGRGGRAVLVGTGRVIVGAACKGGHQHHGSNGHGGDSLANIFLHRFILL